MPIIPLTSCLKVVYNLGSPKRRKLFTLMGFSPRLVYGAFDANVNNAVTSVVERMLYVKNEVGKLVEPPTPCRFKFVNRMNEQLNHFKQTVKPTAPLTKDQFLGTYVGRKRTIYENAFASLKIKPFKISDSYINWFLKAEKVAFTDSKSPVPRGISPRSPRYHVLLGPFIKRIEKNVYDVIAGMFGGKTVFKGLNSFERGKHLKSMWDEFVDPVAIGLDASRFDQHVSEDALKWEHSIYQMYYPNDKFFRYLLSLQLKNKCYGNMPDSRLEFTVYGKRMSGDMNTSLGNCLLMSSMVHAYCQSIRLKKFRLANDGDDCVLVIERKELSKLENLRSWFLEMGFNMKREEHVEVFEQIEFCQSQPVWTPEGYIMVRNPHTSLSKDCVSLIPLTTPKLAKRWMAAVGMGGVALAGGIPIHQEFYQRLVDLGKGYDPLLGDLSQLTGAQYLGMGMKRRYGDIHWMTRVSYWRAFNIPPDRQQALEQEYKNRHFECQVDHANTMKVRDFPL